MIQSSTPAFFVATILAHMRAMYTRIARLRTTIMSMGASLPCLSGLMWLGAGPYSSATLLSKKTSTHRKQQPLPEASARLLDGTDLHAPSMLPLQPSCNGRWSSQCTSDDNGEVTTATYIIVKWHGSALKMSRIGYPWPDMHHVAACMANLLFPRAVDHPGRLDVSRARLNRKQL